MTKMNLDAEKTEPKKKPTMRKRYNKKKNMSDKEVMETLSKFIFIGIFRWIAMFLSLLTGAKGI